MKTRIAILVTGILFLGFVSCNTQNKQKAGTKAEVNKTVTKETKTAQLTSSKVCFVNNKFMGIDQIPVEFEGKTYYGCCKNCIGKLQNIREVRYAIDPLTGAEVDKALAYIVIAPKGNNDVLYFESEDNYLKFTKQL